VALSALAIAQHGIGGLSILVASQGFIAAGAPPAPTPERQAYYSPVAPVGYGPVTRTDDWWDAEHQRFLEDIRDDDEAVMRVIKSFLELTNGPH